MTHTLKFDGASRGNPGAASYGIIVIDESGKEVITDYGYLGVATNNVAEYCGLLRGLIICEKMGIRRLNAMGDSNLVIQHVTGKWKVRNAKLRELYQQIKDIESKFESISYEHVYRKFNKRADKLANQALDELRTPG